MQSEAIYIALGANLPSASRTPRQTLAAALAELETRGVHCAERSSDWHSPAWPDPADPPYVNAAARVETKLDAASLMACLHAVEAAFGRARTVVNAARPLDLDIIDYKGVVDDGAAGPVLPHPRATGRAFVLLPLQEIAPDWTDPLTGQRVGDLIAGLPEADTAPIYRL